MNSSETAASSAPRYGSLLMLALSALVAGAAAGLVGAMFRLSLVWADGLGDIFVKWSHNRRALGFLLVIATCATATGVAARIVRRLSPHASGSGAGRQMAFPAGSSQLAVAGRILYINTQNKNTGRSTRSGSRIKASTTALFDRRDAAAMLRRSRSRRGIANGCLPLHFSVRRHHLLFIERCNIGESEKWRAIPIPEQCCTAERLRKCRLELERIWLCSDWTGGNPPPILYLP